MKSLLLLLATSLIAFNSSFAATCQPTSTYNFNGNADDQGGGKINGELVGANVMIDRLGNAKSALLFDGTKAYVDYGSNFDMGTNDFSISMWVLSAGTADGFVTASDTSSVNWLLVKGLNASSLPIGAGYGVALRLVNGKVMHLDFVTSSGVNKGITRAVSSLYPNDERWHQIGVSRTGAVTQLYIDGKLTGETTAPQVIDVTNGGRLGVGSQVSLANGDKGRSWFKGGIDDLEFYPCGLVEDDVDVIGTLDECFPYSYYPFNRDAFDFVGKRHVKYNGATLYSDRFGNPAQSYLFNGKNGYMDFGDVMNLGAKDFTISFWMYAPEGAMNGPAQDGTTRFTYVLSKGLNTKGNPNGTGFGIKLSTDTKTGLSNLKTIIADSKGTRTNVTVPIGTGKIWHHVAAQREGTALRMYIDGELIKEETITDGIDLTVTDEFLIGLIAAPVEASGSEAYFLGALDDVRFYNCVMSKAAIAEQARAEDDANECENSDLDVQVDAEPSTCGQSDGAMYVRAEGGKPAYSFAWSDGSTTSVAENVPAGLYSIVVTDQLGCQDSAKVVVKDASGPVVTVDSISVSQCEQANGEIFTSIEGDGPFEITWSNGREIPNVDELKPGLYAFTVRDINGCVQGVEIELESNGETAPVIRGYVKRKSDSTSITSARVTLIQFSSEIKMLPLEQTMYVDTNGYFAFEKIIEGDFMVVVEPDSDLEGELFRAYYPSAGHWLKADPIPTACGIEGDITIYVPGKKVLAGKVDLSGAVTEQKKSVSGKTGKTLGDPIPGVDVSLEQIPGGTTAQTTTDEDGLYSFDDIPEGDYEIIIDIPGLPMDSAYIVEVADLEGEEVQLDYLVDTTESVYIEPGLVTAVALEGASQEFTAYPNPFKDNVDFQFGPNATGQLTFSDVTGRAYKTIRINGAFASVDLSAMSDVVIVSGIINGHPTHHRLVRGR